MWTLTSLASHSLRAHRMGLSSASRILEMPIRTPPCQKAEAMVLREKRMSGVPLRPPSMAATSPTSSTTVSILCAAVVFHRESTLHSFLSLTGRHFSTGNICSTNHYTGDGVTEQRESSITKSQGWSGGCALSTFHHRLIHIVVTKSTGESP